MRNERQILLYIIAILFILLMVSGFGYLNYKNKSFEGLSRKITYGSNKHVKYANLNWIVVKDDGRYVTLILAENAKLGAYGDSTNYKTSDVYDYIQNEWLKDPAQAELVVEMEHGALVVDSASRSYVRLIKNEELVNNPIKNDSGTPYWTMSHIKDQTIYALSNGYTEYTTYEEELSNSLKCYKGENKGTINEISRYNIIMTLEQVKTAADPYEMNVITSVTTDQEVDTCYSEYKFENDLFSATGTPETYVTNFYLNKKVEAVGIRPVITVKKK